MGRKIIRKETGRTAGIKRWFLSTALSFVLSASPVWAGKAHPCADDVGNGPLSIREQSFLQMLHLNSTPSAPSALSKGEMEVGLQSTWANTWAVITRQSLIDAETLQLIGDFQYALTDRLQAGVEVPVLWRGGGVMDPFIEGFHETFGLPNGSREKFPRNRFRIQIRREDGTTFVTEDSGVGLQDIVLFSQLTLSCGKVGTASAVRLLISLPTGSKRNLYGSGGADWGAVFILSKRIDAAYIYFNAGYYRFRENDLGGIPLREFGWRIFSGLEYRVWSHFSLIVQGNVSSGMAEDFNDLSRPSGEIALGLKRRQGERLAMEFAFIENLVNLQNTPDFGFHAGLSYLY